ncbi:pseudaminic acid cytidylyltransferase [Marinilabiliaceae bacterium ANBcel2]|nr:pseudaminic acid cytidylyltransferase [Marinilabiliaceae bacterium ANBcel2]
MNNLAIIPARGGSKRIPRKNIKPFLGKPIIAYSIEAALQSNLFSEVMVSTDDEEIASVAIKYGAKVPFIRSRETADDFATLADVVEEVIQQYIQKSKLFDFGCCILPTSPLLQQKMMSEAFELIQKEGYDSVKPVVPFSYPVQRALKLKDNRTEMFYPEHIRSRSQDLEQAYHDAGQFYWFKFDKGMTGPKKGAIVLSDIESQDIDSYTDWQIAEMKYKLLYDTSH